MRRFISPDKDKVDRSESCHLAKFGTKCAFVRRASKEVPRSVKLFIPRQTERAPCGGRTYVWVNWLDLEIASIAALFLSPLFLSPRPFSLDRVLRILSLGRRRRRLREFLALILSQSPTLPPPLKGPVRMTFLKFCFSPSLYRDFESVWGQVERMGRKGLAATLRQHCP